MPNKIVEVKVKKEPEPSAAKPLAAYPPTKTAQHDPRLLELKAAYAEARDLLPFLRGGKGATGARLARLVAAIDAFVLTEA
jgi:hypothetical protein